MFNQPDTHAFVVLAQRFLILFICIPLQSICADTAFENFTGSESCAECHEHEYRLWRDSTHAKAGGDPDAELIIAPFNGIPLHLKDAVVIPSLHEGHYSLNLTGERGLRASITVDAVVGGGYMQGGGTQTYFTKLEDGTLRFIPFEYAAKEALWFCQTNKGWLPLDKSLSLSDCIDWPPKRRLGKECQNCHGSQIQLLLDQSKKRFVTRYKTLNINCESCHGPGKQHIAIMQSDDARTLQDIGMVALSTLSKDESLKVCFQCHAFKDPYGETNYLPGDKLEQHYALTIPFGITWHHYPDGHIRAFGYQKNHLFSDCYINGSLTCTDCHNPHSQGYQNIYGDSLAGRFNNGQCTGCHASKGQTPTAHSHHKELSPGNLCTSCHMPYLQHKIAGEPLRIARSDHRISIPRLKSAMQKGVENACQQCHSEISPGLLYAKIDEWYGEIKPQNKLITRLLENDSYTDITDAAQVLLSEGDKHPMAQLYGLSRFILRYLTPDMPSLDKDVQTFLYRLSDSENTNIKATALLSLHLTQGNQPEIKTFLQQTMDSLTQNASFATKTWAASLVRLSAVYQRRGQLDFAITTLRKALEVQPDFPVAHEQLGFLLKEAGEDEEADMHTKAAVHAQPDLPMRTFIEAEQSLREGNVEWAANRFMRTLQLKPDFAEAINGQGRIQYLAGDLDQALASYKKTLSLAPDLAQTHIDMGDLLSDQGKTDEAITHYLQALELVPKSAEAHNNLGNMLSTKGRSNEAIKHFKLALQLRPDAKLIHSNLANALAKEGHLEEAIEHYHKELLMRPRSARVHYNLANTLFKLNRMEEAIEHYSKVLEIRPDHQKSQHNQSIAQERLDDQQHSDNEAGEAK